MKTACNSNAYWILRNSLPSFSLLVALCFAIPVAAQTTQWNPEGRWEGGFGEYSELQLRRSGNQLTFTHNGSTAVYTQQGALNTYVYVHSKDRNGNITHQDTTGGTAHFQVTGPDSITWTWGQSVANLRRSGKAVPSPAGMWTGGPGEYAQLNLQWTTAGLEFTTNGMTAVYIPKAGQVDTYIYDHTKDAAGQITSKPPNGEQLGSFVIGGQNSLTWNFFGKTYSLRRPTLAGHWVMKTDAASVNVKIAANAEGLLLTTEKGVYQYKATTDAPDVYLLAWSSRNARPLQSKLIRLTEDLLIDVDAGKVRQITRVR